MIKYQTRSLFQIQTIPISCLVIDLSNPVIIVSISPKFSREWASLTKILEALAFFNMTICNR